MCQRIYNEIIKFIYGGFFDDASTHTQKNNVSCTGAKCITIKTAHTQSFTMHYRKMRDFYRFHKRNFKMLL